MASLSLTIRVVVLLAALGNFAGHVKVEDVLTNTAELNRCLTAVRVALTRRGVVAAAPTTASLRPGLGTRPSRHA